MNFDTFNCIVEKQKPKQPILFQLGHDRILSADEIAQLEKKNGLILPKKYRLFLLQYGGGYFGFTAVYSLDCDSDFFLFNHLKYAPKGYIPISDNGCGDVFLIQIQNDHDQEQVYLWEHETNAIQQTAYSDIFEYLVQQGLSISD